MDPQGVLNPPTRPRHYPRGDQIAALVVVAAAVVVVAVTVVAVTVVAVVAVRT